jgi:DNA helicase-2/ATP-dependent DNA helicase PcrA
VQIEVTDDDIAYAERLLLPTGCQFNDERRAFIRCMESRDVVACPGSGKTTALLAKLLILARKMPPADGRGICVLAHTNVAVDVIRTRAAVASASLFRYPNFFGTIQGFVNQFLAGPWYRSEYGRPLAAIDNSRFFGELSKLYSIDFGLQTWLEPRGGLGTLGSYWFSPATLQVGESLDEPIARLSENTDTFRKIQSVRKSILDQGILSFNDAYALALRYLLKKPEVSHAIANRFCLMFLDEAQDTDEHQFRVLDAVCRPEQLVVQRIGDPNQAIYHDQVQTDGFWSPRNPLHFSDSRRYGETITKLLSAVRLDDSITLQPCVSRASYPPHLITFEEGEEPTVLPAFAWLIKELLNNIPHDDPCKAIGWIGKDNTADCKLCIPSYFPKYEKAHRTQNKHLSNLVSYAAYAIQSAGAEGANRFLDIVLQGIARALDAAGIKDEIAEHNYTPSSVEYFWRHEHEKSYNQFRTQIANAFLLALRFGLTPVDLRAQTIAAIKPVWPMVSKAARFLNGDLIDVAAEMGDGTLQARNRFVANNGTVIDVGTVHSVKGETHLATLYLETKYQKDSDASRLIEFLKGNRPKGQMKKAHHQQNLKIAHVAFSRPTHLLVFACRASNITGHEDDLKCNGWVIRAASEVTANKSNSPTSPPNSTP